jgi:hypothetical protein
VDLTLRKLTVLAGFAVVAILASGCNEPKKSPTPPPQPGGGGEGPVGRRVTRPNLRVVRFVADVIPDGRVRMVAQVANTGLQSTFRGSTLSLRRIGEKGDIDELETVEIPRLDMGQSTPPIVRLIPREKFKVSRKITLCAYADVRQQIKEGTDDELDNHTDTSISYGPDLVVKGIVNPKPDEPETLNLVAQLGNVGNVNASSFQATWAYSTNETASKGKRDDEIWREIRKETVPSLPVATRRATELKLAFPGDLATRLAGKTVTVRLTVDTRSRVDELDNTNNAGGIAHSFPPNECDLNVWGLMSWWNRNEAKLHFHSFITNVGRGNVPNGRFNSQWFRTQGVNNPIGGRTGSSGSDDGWLAMSDLLVHEEGETRRPFKFENWKGKNPEFVYTPTVREEGEIVSLRYEVDPYNEVPELSDPKAEGGQQLPTSQFNVRNPAKIGQQVRLGLNGPNNSFVWNFRIPEFIQPNLRIISVDPRVEQDRTGMTVDVNVGNYGTQGTGKWKITVSLDGKAQTFEDANLAPGWGLFGVPFRFRFTEAQRQAGKAQLQVRVEPSRKNRTEDRLAVTRGIQLPEAKMNADVFLSHAGVALLKKGRDPEKPDQYDTLSVDYTVVNAGEKSSGPFKVTIAIEGGPGQVLSNQDGISPKNNYPQETLIDIRSLMKPDKATKLKIAITVDATNDIDRTDNTMRFDDIFELPAIDPQFQPADLVISEVRGASKANQTVTGKFRMLATVANIGGGPSANCGLNWWVNNRMVYEGGVPALRSGESAVGWCYADLPLPAGTTEQNPAELSVSVWVDQAREVHEANRINNEKTVKVKSNDFFEGLDPLPRTLPANDRKEKDPDLDTQS